MNDRKAAWFKEAQQLLIRYCGDFSPFLIEKAQNAYIYSSDGRAILDFTSGQMCSIFGHNHPRILQAMQQAGERSIHLLSAMLSPPVLELAEKLIAILPEGLESLGIRVEVEHMAPTPPGFTVTATAELLEVNGRKLVFRVEARDAREIVGKGTHTRAVVDTHRFRSKAEAKLPLH